MSQTQNQGAEVRGNLVLEIQSAEPKDDYNVKLEVFEGPLDLLLYLIKKEEVDIYHIPIERITTQYMEYIGLMRMLDLEFAGEFLVMAATLMMIKSRMLLPVEEREELEPEEDDPRWELIKQLVEYKKFKDAAENLQTMRLIQENIFERGEETIEVPRDKSGVLEEVSIFDLIAAFNQALKRAEVDEVGELYADTVTVADKIEEILSRINSDGRIEFTSLFKSNARRKEIVCAFLALLELIRLHQIRAIQEAAFGHIVIVGVQS
ncbi:MAG: segregation/condensation protein A [Lentisphaerae bacterium]|nr:segregation/condensation protein A [Lentisphaerota bacterium]